MTIYRVVLPFLIGVTMALNANLSAAGGMNSPRLAAFKNVVGFDEALAKNKLHRDEFIDVDWTRVEVPSQLAGWKTGTRELQPIMEDGGRTFYWQFERGDESMTIIVRIYPPGGIAAGQGFLEIANATTTMAIPYIAGPRDLGALSAIEQGQSNSVFWFDRNVCVEVTRSHTNVSHMEVAYWVQDRMRKHIAKTGH